LTEYGYYDKIIIYNGNFRQVIKVGEAGRAYNVLHGIFCVLVVLAFLTIFYASGHMWLFLLGACVLCAVLLPRLPQRYFALVLCLVSLAVRLMYIYVLKNPQSSDFSYLYDTARSFARGDYSYLKSGYFQVWSYQISLVIFNGFLLRLWDSLYFLQAVNACFSVGSIYLLYRIARSLTGEGPARLAAVFYSFIVFSQAYVTVLSNQINSGFFMLLALFLYICVPKERLRFYVRFPLMGLCMALSQFFRPDALVMLAALLAAMVFSSVRRKSFKSFGLEMASFGLALAVYVLVFQGLSLGSAALGYTEKGLVNGDPAWKFVMGLDTESGGQYSKEKEVELYSLMDQGLERGEAEKQLLKDDLSVDKRAMLTLMLDKIRLFWTGSTLNWTGVKDYRLLSLQDVQSTLLILLAGLGAVYFFRRRPEPEAYIVPFYFMATFCVYLLIEVQERYSYPAGLFLAIMAAYGFKSLEELRNYLDFNRLRRELP